MTCTRCGGLITSDTAEDTAVWERIIMHRCLNCGDSFDMVSRKNFVEHPEPRKEHARGRIFRLPKGRRGA